MKIESTQLGTLDVAEQHLYHFADGLYGFEEYKRFALLIPDESLPFAYLQAVEQPSLCLMMVNPFAVLPSYEFDLATADEQSLDSPTAESVAVWAIVTAPKSLQDATVNLMAPVVLNLAANKGRQIVLHQSRYSTRTPLIPSQKEGA